MPNDAVIWPAYFLLVVNVEFEHIGACIVTAWIKFHFCCSCLAEVEVGNNEFLLIPDGFGQEFAEGINDAAAAAADDLGQAIDFLFAVQLTAWIIAAGELHVRVDEVAASLKTDVPGGIDP